MAENGYGKRPLWQWILIYVVIGGIIYFAVYYFFLRGSYSKSGSGNYNTPGYTSPTPTSMQQNTTPAPTSGQNMQQQNPPSSNLKY